MRRDREVRELVVDVADEEEDAGEDDHRDEDRWGEDEAPLHEGTHRRERAERLAPAALARVEREHLLRVDVQVVRVVTEEPLRVHGARERLIVAALERLEELLADPGVLCGLREGDAHLLALLAQRVTEARHYASSPFADMP